MNLRLTRCFGALLALLTTITTLHAQDGLPTLDEALEISKQTGKPILAMAGQKT